MAERGKANGRGRGFRVLVIDDAEGIRTYLGNLLEMKGYEVDTAESGSSGLALIEAGASPDVILLDVMMPEPDGLATLRRIRELDGEVPVVMLSVVGRASTIVEAMRDGATDYLNKPFEEEELEATLAKVLEKKRLEEERDELLRQAGSNRGVLWISDAMIRVRDLVEQVADTDVTILIGGESGTGKEVVARALHEASNRARKPFVKVNCAALPEQLLESELFGYEKGAFTGAASRKTGKFEVANHGTIFLDEIGEMSPGLQAKLLQVLQDSTFTRLGGNKEIAVDVRVVCATHRALEQMVSDGSFRQDLFFRLNVVNVLVPPLRERREEIAPLVDLFLERYGIQYGRPAPRPSPALMQAFERYAFPGNVRELENLIKRIVVLESETPVLNELLERERSNQDEGRFQALLAEVEQTAGEVPLREVGRRAAQEAERETIRAMLQLTGWNRKQAARKLHVSYKTLLQKIRECELEPDPAV